MRRSNLILAAVVAAGVLAGISAISACGSTPGGFTKSGDDGGSSGGGNGADGSFNLLPGADGSGSGGGSSGGGPVCPADLQCNVTCPGGGTTSITGKVYDPAGKNPLYNVAVYVPAVPLTPLPKGVPTGNDACSCGALFQSGSLTNTTTAIDGTFTLNNVPVGSSVPLVLQIGKWRRQISVNVTQCAANAQPDKSLSLPGTVAAGDTNDNIPDIAVSTGSADTLECLMLRIGIPAAEYVAGAGTTGHVHVFSGGGLLTLGGTPETPAMTGAPASSTDLWSTQAQLMPYDIVLLSCEGGETYNANPPALEAYLNAGGRAFASHFHYAWFSGPLESLQSYAAPPDWGAHGSDLATWTVDKSGGKSPMGGIIDTTLNGSTKPFPKGVALSQWLGGVGALGQNGVASTELAIYQPRYNATVAAANTPSQPWITSDSTGIAGQTMYFSFDTPVNAVAAAEGGAPQYCGRAVFSDLHVGGNPSTNDTSPPPSGCDDVDLSPQEKALEFMLFDLSSCVIPDTATIPTDAGLPSPPPK
jgi:hypothetical protein